MTLKKIDTKHLDKMEFTNNYFIENRMKEIHKDLSNKFDNIIIDGLRKKGFEFDSEVELNGFIKRNCSVIDDEIRVERIFYIDKMPFLIHRYNPTFVVDNKINERSNTITASIGEYAYL